MTSTPTPALALKLIHENREQQAPFLDLGNCSLTSIPLELAGLTHLRALNLGQFYIRYSGNITTDSEPFNLKDSIEINVQETGNKGAPNRLPAEDISAIGIYLGITHLYLTHLQLKDISALSTFSSLEALYLGFNELTDISPLRTHTHLRDLFLVQNRINDVSPLEGLVQLKTLNLSGNQIANVSALAGLKSLSVLIISKNLISDLSPLRSMKDLHQLILFGNTVSSVAPLANLIQLEKINLADNQINDVTPLQKLLKIKELRIQNNQIKDLTPLSALPYLTILDAAYNQIEALPSTFSLPYLTDLYLGNNSISELSPVRNLPALEVLDLANNQITDTSPMQDMQLGCLILSDNAIQDVSPLCSLKQLRTLNLERNKIERIRPFAFSFASPVGVQLDGNPIQDMRLELVVSDRILKSTSSSEIDAFFKSLEGDEAVHAEVKIILVGNSTAGKTSLANLLRGQSVQKLEKSTHGIQVYQWKIRRRDFADVEIGPDIPEQITVNVWDFGGQEYYHGTHQLFLDKNAIYLLLWEPDTNRSGVLDTEYSFSGNKLPVEQFNYQYWLDCIRFYANRESGSQPPIFMIQNKLDKNNGQVNWPDPALLLTYEVKEALAVSAMLALSKAPENREYHYRFQIFRNKLLATIRQKAIRNVPASWQKIRECIQESTSEVISKKAREKNPFARMAEGSRTLDRKKFRQACRETLKPASINGNQIDALVRYLHGVGAVYYNPAVEDCVYLDPNILAQKIYGILDQGVLHRKGRLSLPYLSPLADLMSRWGIIFLAPQPASAPLSALPVSETQMPKDPQTEWIAAQYLPDDHPLEGLYQIAASGLEQNYFIVRSPLFHFKKALRQLVFSIGNDPKVHNKEFWKNGILFTVVEGGLRVLVKGIKEENNGKILVYVERRSGNERQTTQWEGEIFSQIISAMTESTQQIFAGSIAQIGQTNTTETDTRRAERASAIQISRNGVEFVKIPDLLQQVRNEIILVPSYKPDGSVGKILSVSDFAPFLTAFGQKPPRPTIFMSYAHDDLKLREELGAHLSPIIKRLKQADAWHDGLIKPGEPWDEAIMSQLRKADVVLLLISVSFLNSDFSWDKEMLPALERHKRGEARVIPILLSDCLWQDLPFAELEMVPKEPQNARLLAVTQWPDRAKALTTVVKRIQEVLQEMKI